MTEMEYQRRLNEDAAEEAFIAGRVEFYMSEGGCCDPFNPEAFCERLSEAVHDDCLAAALEPLLAADKLDYWAIGKAICSYVEVTCEELAERFAKDDLRIAQQEAKEYAV